MAIGLILSSALAAVPLAYAPELKADWRGFSADLFRGLVEYPRESVVVIVSSSGPGPNVEVETARYYLPELCTILRSEQATSERLGHIDTADVFFTVGLQGRPA